MSTHLDKAKAALSDAAAMEVDIGSEALPKRYLRLLDLAQIQAQLAQAEALESIVEQLEYWRDREQTEPA